MADRLIWGSQLGKKVKTVKVLKNSDGNTKDIPLLKGLVDIWNPKTKTLKLQIKNLIGMGNDDDQNLAWSICHDLAHSFDVVYGNLTFDRDKGTLTYLGRKYNLAREVNSSIPPEYSRFRNFRESPYYQAMDYWEPWEVRALMAADACMADYRRGDLCPNLIKETM